MAKLAIIFLTMATVTSVILITGGTNDLSNCNKSPHVFISTGDHTLRCHTCHKCPKEMGMSIKCEKQVVSTAVNIACVDCVAGVNYSSTNDYSQCKPCPKICNDQEIRGECAKDGDHRKCIPCRQNWYYDRIKAKCLPCSCWNMSQEAKQKCSDNGFSFELHCKKPEVKLTTPRPADVGNSTKSSNASKIILIISSVGICGYCCFAGMRLIKFKMMKSRWPVGAVEWVSSVFCCHYCVAHCECHTEPENPEIVNVDQPKFQRCFGRQNSCPVTHDEFERATRCTKTKINDFHKNGYHPIAESDSKENISLVTNTPRECLKEKLTILGMNSGVFSDLCSLLNTHNTLGYEKLAGLMDCSTQDVKLFKLTDNPAGTLLETWGTKRGNNVIELIKLLQQMERDDLVGKLQKELNKVSCPCASCGQRC